MIFFLSFVKSTIQTYIIATLNEDNKMLSLSISIPSVFSNDFKAYLNESEKRHKFLKVEGSKYQIDKSKKEILKEISTITKDKYFEFNDWSVFNVKLNSSVENYDLEFYFGEVPVKRSIKFNIKDFISESMSWSLFCYCPEFIIEKLKTDKIFLKTVLDSSKKPVNPYLHQIFLNRKANLDKIIGLICVRGEFYNVRERIKKSSDNRIYITYRISYKMSELMEEIYRFRKGMRELKMLFNDTLKNLPNLDLKLVSPLEELNIDCEPLKNELIVKNKEVVEKAEVLQIKEHRINFLYQNEFLSIEEMPSTSIFHEMANIKMWIISIKHTLKTRDQFAKRLKNCKMAIWFTAIKKAS